VATTGCLALVEAGTRGARTPVDRWTKANRHPGRRRSLLSQCRGRSGCRPFRVKGAAGAAAVEMAAFAVEATARGSDLALLQQGVMKPSDATAADRCFHR
jgi:hypothetical protein